MTTETLTRGQIRAVPAGRELDAMIAVHLVKSYLPDAIRLAREGAFAVRTIHVEATGEDEDTFLGPPRYSTDIAAAWEVVNRFRPYVKVDGRGLAPDTGQSCWVASLWVGGPEIQGSGDTAPLAICRAALLAVLGATP